MSRGGFRGRGRGRGGGGADPRNPLAGTFGSMSQLEIKESLSRPAQHSGMLYPPLDEATTSYLPMPSQFEDSITRYTIELNDILEHGQRDETGVIGAPWRIEGERKVVGIEIESYSNRIAPSSTPKASSSQLNPQLLKLDESMFPPLLWRQYFHGAPDKKAKGKQKSDKKRKLEALQEGGDGDKEDEEAPKSDVDKSSEEDFDFDEDDSDQDYDANYFDNGEGDDDSGGDDAGDDGGGYDGD